MLSNLRILHPPSSDNPTNLPVLVLTVDANRYIFNTPEGTTRTFSQRGARGGANAFGHVFLPRVGVEECAGIFGIIMGRADLGMRELTIHGPPVLTHYLATARSYARRGALHVKVNEASLGTKSTTEGEKANDDEGVLFTDKHISVLAVPVFPKGWEHGNLHKTETASSDSKGLPQSKRARTASSGLSGTCTPTALSQQFLDTMFPGKSTSGEADSDGEGAKRPRGRARASASALDDPPLAPTMEEQGILGQAPALSYIVKGNKVRGRFDAAKAKSLGVPEGQYFAMLTNGQDITIERPCDWSRWDEKTRSRWLIRAKILTGRNDPGKASRTKKLGKGREAVVNDEMFSNQRLEKVTIASNEVVAPSRPASVFMQIYLPTPAYLEDFLQEGVQKRLTETSSEKDSLVHAIVHAVHPAVLRDERYKNFIKKYPKAHHIMACRPFVPDMLAFPSAALANLRMSRLDHELFKVPQYSLEAQQDIRTLNLGKISVQACGQDTVISLQPPSPPKHSDINTPDFDFALGSQQAEDMESFKTALALRPKKQSIVQAAANWVKYLRMASEMKSTSTNTSLASSSSDGGLLLTALGTGSSSPSKYRNVSGMLLHLPDEKGFILLDCGEGSYGQLVRKFADQVPNILLNMKLMFLSHIHGDHHMGASRILLERQKLSPVEPLYVISDGFTQTYLQEVDKIQSLGIARNGSSTNEGSVILLDAEHFDYKHGVVADKLARQSSEDSLLSQDELWSKKCEEEARHLISRGNGSQTHSESSVHNLASALKRNRSGARAAVLRHRNNLQYSLGDCQVLTAEVDHRTPFCYGIVLRSKEWSAAYSGDTRPCENLVNAGQDVDVLIHEATFEENEPDMAHYKGHSTTAQAMDIARRMRARRLLLTHFSQRYPKIAHVSSKGHEMPIGMAFDLMTMRLDDIGKTTRYREALQMLFESEAGEDEDSADIKEVQMNDANESSGKQSQRQRNANGASSPKALASGAGAEKQTSAVHASKDAGSQHSPDSNAESTPKEGSVRRALVKDYEFQYIVIHIYASKKRSGPTQPAAPTRWAVLDSLKRCAEDLHGLVGSSFRTDVVLYESLSRLSKACSDAEMGPDDVCAVVKVATPHAPALVSTVAAGIPISSGGVSFICRYVGTLSAFDLSTITAMLSRTAGGRAGASLGSVAAPGRIWFDSLAS